MTLFGVRTMAPGSKDEDTLALAVREERIILTFDKDFGELAWRAGLPASTGIVLFRLPAPAPAKVGAILAARISERIDWAAYERDSRPVKRLDRREDGRRIYHLSDPRSEMPSAVAASRSSASKVARDRLRRCASSR